MANGPYTKLYHVLMDDYPAVWRSDAQLATFVRLLIMSDKWWPQYAPRPFGRPTYAYRSLVECGLVVESKDGNGYTIKGLEKERAARSEHGRHAASTRWSNAASNARAMPSKAEQSKAEQGALPTATGNGVFLGYPPKKSSHEGQHIGCVVCEAMEGSPARLALEKT